MSNFIAVDRELSIPSSTDTPCWTEKDPTYGHLYFVVNGVKVLYIDATSGKITLLPGVMNSTTGLVCNASNYAVVSQNGTDLNP